MLTLILSSLYFILPAAIGNMCPVVAGACRLPLGIPIHEKLFGSGKTWRGLIVAYIGALLMLWGQLILQQNEIFETLRLLDYEQINLFLYAALFGIGAIAGDMSKSFFKRRLKKPSGTPWFPFDQIDTLAAIIVVYPFYQLDAARILTLVLLMPILHILTNIISYTLGLKKVWW